jgi:hypothetical protein
MPGFVGGIARIAVITGTANAVDGCAESSLRGSG